MVEEVESLSDEFQLALHDDEGCHDDDDGDDDDDDNVVVVRRPLANVKPTLPRSE